MLRKIFIAIFLMVPIVILASEQNQMPAANINISPDWGKAACASLPGKGITLGWKGVEDKRAVQSVGILKKGKDEFEVNLSKPVKDVVGEALITALRNCGFEVDIKDNNGLATTVDVNDFFAGAKKGFFTGETEAKGAISLHFRSGAGSYDFNLGATKADKRLKKKDVKQLEEVLTNLLESLVAQVGESPQLFNEIKRLAGK